MPERIVIQCPECAAKFGITDANKLGKSVQCSKCSASFVAKEMGGGSAPKRPKKAAAKKPKDEYDFNYEEEEEAIDDDDEVEIRSSRRGGRRGRAATKPKKSGPPVAAIVGGAIGGVIVLGAIAYFAFGKKSDQVVAQADPAASSSAVTTTPASPTAQATPVGSHSAMPAVTATDPNVGHGATPTPGQAAVGANGHSAAPTAAVGNAALNPLPGAAKTPPVADTAPSLPALEPVPGMDITIQIAGKVDFATTNRITNRIRQLSGANSTSMSVLNNVARCSVKNMADAKTLSERIDFGTVSNLDVAKRSFTVTLDLEKVAKLPDDDRFRRFGNESGSGLSRPGVPSPVSPISAAATQQKQAVPLETTTIGGIELAPESTLNGNVQLLIPKGFTLMSEKLKATKYPAASRPQAVFTNKSGTVNIAVTQSKQVLTPDGLPNLLSSMGALFKPAAKGELKTELVVVDGRQRGEMRFTINALDTEIVNHMVLFCSEGRMLVVSANATTNDYPAFKDALETCLLSLKVPE